mmetsp:Transcript_19277/g.50090  ORF Transcript_19277/g.50090 Transcript_19277/m.50090 type:complete len:423 (-) Transcript_19277:216-1484(-)
MQHSQRILLLCTFFVVTIWALIGGPPVRCRLWAPWHLIIQRDGCNVPLWKGAASSALRDSPLSAHAFQVCTEPGQLCRSTRDFLKKNSCGGRCHRGSPTTGAPTAAGALSCLKLPLMLLLLLGTECIRPELLRRARHIQPQVPVPKVSLRNTCPQPRPSLILAHAAAPAAAAAARSLVRLHAPQGGARPQVGGIMGHTAPGEHGLVLRRSLGLAGAGCWLQPLCHAGWGGFTQGRGFAREWGTLASRWTGRRHAVGGLQWWWAGRRATEAERAVGRAAEVPVPAVFAKGRRKVQGGHLRLHNAYSSIQDDCTQALHSPMEAQTESCQLVHAAIKISAVWWCRVIDGTGGFWTSGTILRNLAVPFRSSSCLPLNLLQKALCLCLEELQMCKLRKHGVLRIFCNRDAEKRVGLHLEGLPLYRVV